MTTKLDGKVALITGSGRGIGRSIALKLASEGARIVVNDLDTEPAQDTVQAIRDAGGQAIACVGSVTASDFADRFIGAADDTPGRIIKVNRSHRHAVTGSGLRSEQIICLAAICRTSIKR